MLVMAGDRPWVRDAITPQRIWALLFLCTLPALLWACQMLGAEILLGLAANPDRVADGWRINLAAALSGSSADSLWDCWVYGAARLLPLFGAALSTALLGVFALARFAPGALPTGSGWRMLLLATLFTLLAAPELALYWVVIGMALALLIECANRRWLRHWPLPALALALLLLHLAMLVVQGVVAFSVVGAIDAVALLLGIGGLLGMLAGLLQWRRSVGALIAVMVTAIVVNALSAAPAQPWYTHVLLGHTLLAIFFLVADPAQAAYTHFSQWLGGIVAGALIVLLRTLTPLAEDAVLLAVLGGNLLVNGLALLHRLRGRDKAKT